MRSFGNPDIQRAVLDILVESIAVHFYPTDRIETPADTRLDKATARLIALLCPIELMPLPTGSRSARPRSGNADKPPRPRKRRASLRRPK